MKWIFLDTNVIIDLLADRKPFSNDAEKLFDLAFKGQVVIFVSAVSYNNIYYILRQSLKEREAVKQLEKLFKFTQVAELSKKTIQQALTADFNDFEDAVQFYSALNTAKAECIVTRDTKRFKKSTLPVFSPHEVLKLISPTN